MSAQPIIGINMDLLQSPKSKHFYSVLHAGYYDCIVRAGGVPLVIPPFTKRQELEPILDLVDGLMLTSGDDLNPKKIGLRPHIASKVMQARREAADRMLLETAQQRRLPVLGIGVAMQMINCYFGGTLYQHLPEDLPRAMPHHDAHGGAHRHAIDVTPGSRMDDIYGGGDIRVNSAHHQAVRRVAPGFVVSAMAPDGVTEAIESIDFDWFCVGVQWNPHSETGSALDWQLFEALIECCKLAKEVPQPKLMAA